MNQIQSMILIVFAIMLVTIPAYGEEYEIPEWVKGIASFWVEGNISDEEFAEAIKFLLEQKIIQIEGYGKVNIIEEEILPMELTVTTDKDIYNIGDKMEISGTRPNNNQDSISILFLTPENMIASMKGFTVNGSGEYSTSLKIGGTTMTNSGDYILRIKYDSKFIEKIIQINVQ